MKETCGLLPADAQPSEIPQPTHRSFDGPATSGAAEASAVVSELSLIGAVGSNHLDPLCCEPSVELVTVVGFVPADARRVFPHQHEAEETLHELGLVVVGGSCVDRDLQPASSDQDHDLTPGLRAINATGSTLGHAKRAVDFALVRPRLAAILQDSCRSVENPREYAGLNPLVEPEVLG